MRQHLVWIAALAALPPGGAGAEETSWIFSAPAYTHSPATGQRVAQYCPEQPSYLRYDDTYQESGYRHNLITIGSGSNADRTNIVQTWGLGLAIRPYGEWEHPYRPCATPYSAWGGYGGVQNPGMRPYNAGRILTPPARCSKDTGAQLRSRASSLCGPPGGQPSGPVSANVPGRRSARSGTVRSVARRSARSRPVRTPVAGPSARSEPWDAAAAAEIDAFQPASRRVYPGR